VIGLLSRENGWVHNLLSIIFIFFLENNLQTSQVLESLREKLRSSSPDKNFSQFRNRSKSPISPSEMAPQSQKNTGYFASIYIKHKTH